MNEISQFERLRSELTLLYELSQAVNSPEDVSQRLDSALRLMASHLHMMRGTITLVSPVTGEIRIEASYGLNPEERARGRYARGEGITGRVIESGKGMCISNVSREPLFLNRTRSRDLKRENISFICVPISLNGEVVGALSVDQLLADPQTLEDEMRLLHVITMLLAHAALESQSRMDAGGGDGPSFRPADFIGNSEAMQLVYQQIAQVGPSSTTVLLQGESGTGKELAALAIHKASSRGDKPFIAVNCAALPESLIESELFGHERGAFTGAQGMRKGRFELADGGTLFLDEIGELPLLTQAKLLRVLQTRSFERLGGVETRNVDVRFIAATNCDLGRMVEEGAFRRDLFYRINVFPICMPPLRRREDDILPLCTHFLRKFGAAEGRKNIRISLAVMDMLTQYPWPGNVRELQNVMERAVLLLGQDNLLMPSHLPPALKRVGKGGDAAEGGMGSALSVSLQERLDELERAYIVEALKASRGHLGRAAAELGLTERIMALRMKKYDISYKEFRRRDADGSGRVFPHGK
ncbi:MAG: sigma 54-interacting transcriptional regulator [Desulfovibrio sp.]|nr:sigma 54-interacting transcriptional regulator [Desulfovibrio sp.]